MDEQGTILLEIKVSEEQVKEKVVAARVAIAELRKERALLDKDYKAGLVTTQQYAQGQQNIGTLIKAQTATMRSNQKTLDDYGKSQKAAAGSLDQMRAQSALLNQEFQSMSKEMRQSTDEGRLLAKQLAAINEEIIDTNREVNQFKPNIGNYPETIKDLNKLIAELTERYDELTIAERANDEVGGKLLRQINALTDEQEKHQKVIDNSRKGVKDYLRDVTVLGVNVGATADSFASGASGAATFAKAIFTGRGALIALTAIPIVALLSGLYIILTKSQKGMDFLAQATGAVSSVFSAFSQKVIAIGEGLSDLWENPKKAAIEFGNFVQQNLINRFTALGVIIDGIKSGNFGKITDGAIQLGTGVANATGKIRRMGEAVGDAAKRGSDLVKMNQAIEASEIKLEVQRGKSLKIIEKNKQISEDATKSTAVRAAAAQKAFAEEEKLQKAQQRVQKQRIDAAKEEAKINGNRREDQKKVADAQAQYDEIEADSIGRRTEIQNNLNAINAEGQQKALENAKKLASEQMEAAELAYLLAKQRGESTNALEEEILNRQIKLIQARADAEKAAVENSKGAADQRRNIQLKADAEILESAKQLAAKLETRALDISDAQIAAQLALAQKGSDEELKLQKDALETRRLREKTAAVDTIKNKEELQAQLNRIDAQVNADLETLEKNYEQDAVNRGAAAAAAQLKVRLDFGDQSLATEREIARERIKLDEETQLKLLEIDKKYQLLQVKPNDKKGLDKVEQDYQDRKTAILANASAARIEISAQERAAVRNDELAGLEEVLITVGEKSKHELGFRKRELNYRKEYLKKQEQAELDNVKLTEQQKSTIRTKYQQQQEELQREYNQRLATQIVDTLTNAAQTIDSLVTAIADSQIAALDREQKAILSSAALTAEGRQAIEEKYAKKREAIEKAANEKKKKTATAMNFINTAVAITKSFAELGPIFGPIGAALALAAGVAQQIQIDQQEFEDGGVLARGGILKGPSHKQGGIKLYGRSGAYYGEAEGDEIILTKGVYRNPALRAQASAINVMGGGQPIAGAGFKVPAIQMPTYTLPPRFEYGGQLSASLDQTAMSNAIIEGMKHVNVQVAVKDIIREVTKVTMAEVNADN